MFGRVSRPAPAGIAGLVVVLAVASVWAAGFGWLAVQRHLAGGSHAEDLGFTDQVLSNFLRGHWFRMSIYQGATWNTEIDISHIPRPDSLLAFHAEPMLVLLVPVYALGGGAVALLVLQAVALAGGAVPAYRLGRHASESTLAGIAVAAAYLLSPLGQWAVLADFHTSTLAAPLLLLAAERLVVEDSAPQALTAATLALTAREDVGPVVAVLGVVVALTLRTHVRTGLAMAATGVAWTILSLVVIRIYAGGASPFDVRYGATVGAGPGPAIDALLRKPVLDYARTLALSGGWLGLLAPLALAPALPSLALNALSTSPWMAAGKAHYSGLVLPLITIAAAMAFRRLRKRQAVLIASLGVIVSGSIGYLLEGAGPFGGNYAPAFVDAHAHRASAIAARVPPDATISASSSLVPRVSRRAGVYVFPAVLDAEYVFLDLRASPSPTSAGDVFLRVRTLLAAGGWRVDSAEDGLLLLQRAADAEPLDIASLSLVLTDSENVESTQADQHAGGVSLVSAALVPSSDGAIDVDGPHWILRTTWRAERQLAAGTRLTFWLDFNDGQHRHVWDIASLWWNPPERWAPGQPVSVDVPDVPARQFHAWQATWTDR